MRKTFLRIKLFIFPSIIVEAKDENNFESIKNIIQDNIDPSEMGLSIDKIIQLKDGKLVIKCNSKR